MDWRHKAACISEDPELFFPISDGAPYSYQTQQAINICNTCKVRIECLNWALNSNQESGIWGGTTEEQRRKLRKKGILSVT